MLPYNIIEDISECLLPTPFQVGQMNDNKICSGLALTKDFVSMMHVCREWRRSLLPRYYKTAVVQMYKEAPKLPWMINLADNISEYHRSMVKRLIISIDMSILLLPDEHPRSLKRILADSPIFQSARYLNVDVNFLKSKSQDVDVNVTTYDTMQLMELKAFILAQHIYRIAPNITSLCCIDETRLCKRESDPYLYMLATIYIRCLVRPNLLHLYVHNPPVHSLMKRALLPIQLCYLHVDGSFCFDYDYEIVIRNAKTLKDLHMRVWFMTHSNRFIYSPNLPDCTIVYPQLRRLVIVSYMHEFQPDSKQPHSNPFPKLRALVCKGAFPFDAPKILTAWSALQHLEFTVDKGFYEMLQNQHVINIGFSNLSYLSVDLSYLFSRELEDGGGIKGFFQIITEMSRSTQVLVLPQYCYSKFKDIVLTLEFPHCLRKLVMPSYSLEIDELLMLLSKLLYLQEVSVGLYCSLECTYNQVPSDKVIQGYQQRFKEIETSVHRIKLQINSYCRSQQMVENVILLADILPNVLFVHINHNSWTTNETLYYIHEATQRPIYRNNKRLQQVTFTAG